MIEIKDMLKNFMEELEMKKFFYDITKDIEEEKTPRTDEGA